MLTYMAFDMFGMKLVGSSIEDCHVIHANLDWDTLSQKKSEGGWGWRDGSMDRNTTSSSRGP